MDALEIERLIITTALLGGAYVTYTCPFGNSASGRGLLSCHIYEISGLIGLATITILYANR